MGSMNFTRASDGKTISFDSSPQYTLPKAFGFVEGSVELRVEEETPMLNTYSVYAKQDREATSLSKVGVLKQKTRAAIWAGQK